MIKITNSKKLFITGTSNKPLATKIAEFFGSNLSKSEIINFADGELSFILKDEVKGRAAVLIQSLSFNPNVHLMELLIMIDTVISKKPKSVQVIIPYLGYSRSDREVIKGESVSASMIPKLLHSVGIKKILSLDVHSQRVIDYFVNNKINLVNIDSTLIFTDYLKHELLNNAIIVSPDKGGSVRAKKASAHLGLPFFQFSKIRPARNKVQFKKSNLDLQGKDILIFEDIIDTAGTIIGVAEMLKDMGCRNIYIFATHGLFSGIAIDRINKSSITKVVVTDTVDNGEKIILSPKLEILSIVDKFIKYLS